MISEIALVDTAEIEPDDAGDSAEEGEADEHIERKLELCLSDVVAVAEQPGIAEAEAAQVVETGEEEVAAEAAALGDSQRGAGGEAAASDQLEGLDGIGLQIGEEAVAAACGQKAAAQLGDHRGTTDGAAGAVSRGIPTVGRIDLGLRVEAANSVQLRVGQVGGAAQAVEDAPLEQRAADALDPGASFDATEGRERIGEQPLHAELTLQIEDLAGVALKGAGRRRETAEVGAGEARVAALLEGIEEADAPDQALRSIDIERERVGQAERAIDCQAGQKRPVAQHVGKFDAALADRREADAGAADGRAAPLDAPVAAQVERIIGIGLEGDGLVGEWLRLARGGLVAGRNGVLFVEREQVGRRDLEQAISSPVKAHAIEALRRERGVLDRSCKIGDSFDASILQEPEIVLAAGLAGENDRFAGERERAALVDRRVGEPLAGTVLGIQPE